MNRRVIRDLASSFHNNEDLFLSRFIIVIVIIYNDLGVIIIFMDMGLFITTVFWRMVIADIDD